MNVVRLEAFGWWTDHRSNPCGNQGNSATPDHWNGDMWKKAAAALWCTALLYLAITELLFHVYLISSNDHFVPETQKEWVHVPSLQSIFRPLDVIRSPTGPSKELIIGLEECNVINMSAEFEQLEVSIHQTEWYKNAGSSSIWQIFYYLIFDQTDIRYIHKTYVVRFLMLDRDTFWLRKGQINISI